MKVIAISLLILVILSLGCASINGQIRMPSEYQSVVYQDKKATPHSEDEVLAFLERDQTDRNVWLADEYMCQEFASDLWWNAYNEGIEGCLVGVFRGSQGHWIVKFNTTDGWLWVEPHADTTSNDGFGYQIYFTLCGNDAFDSCIEDWDLYWLLEEYDR